MHYLTVAVGQESRHSLLSSFFRGLSQAAIKTLARAAVSSEAQVANGLLPSDMGWPRVCLPGLWGDEASLYLEVSHARAVSM